MTTTGTSAQAEIIAMQTALHDDVTRYVNGGCLSKVDRALARHLSVVRYARHAKSLVRKYIEFSAECSDVQEASTIRIEPYQGGNEHVLRMMQVLEPLGPLLHGAYVHGSLGAGDENAYSDFDGLVILSDATMRDAAKLEHAARGLGDARQIMYEMDPLQHHGWFVLTEADLQFYCDAWFPKALFTHAKSLLSQRGTSLGIASRDSTAEFRRDFVEVAGAVERLLQQGLREGNAFRVKSLLSMFMLLPALFIQATEGRSVFKKESFDIVRGSFTEQEWSAMDDVSEIRRAWRQDFSPSQRKTLCVAGPRRKMAVRRAPPVDTAIRDRLTPDLATRMGQLVQAMSRKAGVAP